MTMSETITAAVKLEDYSKATSLSVLLVDGAFQSKVDLPRTHNSITAMIHSLQTANACDTEPCVGPEKVSK